MAQGTGPPRWARAVLSLGIFLVAGMACGPLAPRPVPPATVKLGLVAPFSGVYQRTGERVLDAVKLALAERNGRGGAAHLVELVAHDDRSDLAQGAAAARRLAEDPEVVAVLGHLASPSAEGALPVYREAGLPAVLLGSTAQERGDPDGLVVLLTPSVAAVAQAAADFALQRQARTAAVVAGPRSQDLALAETLRQAAQHAGLRLLRTEVLFPASTEYREAVARLAGVAPDVLFLAASLPTGAAFWKEAAGSARFAVVVGGVTPAPEDFQAVAGPASRTAYVPSPIPGFSASPPLAAFAARYREQWGRAADPMAALAYDGAGLLLEAIDQAWARHGSVSRAGVRATLEKLHAYEGITGRAVFDPSGQLAGPSLWFVSAATDEAPGGRSGAASPHPLPAR